nr:MAG TPA: Large Terminase [Caudoviricetes sp.]
MKYIKRYCDKILNEEIRSCEEQKLLCQMVLRIFEEEDIYIDEEKVDKYFGLEKYFPFALFDWERFCFVLHCCTYRRDGMPRFPDMLGYMGRGSGKNGFVSYEDFSLLSPVNGIRNYNIQSFAAAEDNAKTSFEEVRTAVLTEHENKLKRFYHWNKEEITCTKTNSKWTYHTSAPRTKDGGRPGKINIDEVHVFENKKLITVAQGGLGKVPDPRILITSTDGLVRDGPLDEYKARGRAILRGEKPDNGFLPFMCHCTLDELSDEENWIKAIPSLDQFPVLKERVRKDYNEYLDSPFENREIIVKRFNCIEGEDEDGLASWDIISDCCSGEMPEKIQELTKYPCIFGLDCAAINDFFSAVIITLKDGVYYCEQHTWICEKSHDLKKIRFPVDEAVARGEATMVNDSEIPAELPVRWIRERTRGRMLLAGACDNFRYSYIRRECEQILGMRTGKRQAANKYGKDFGWVYMNRPSHVSGVSEDIFTGFNHRRFYFGDSKIMRWYLGNVKKVMNKNGNVAYEKIEPKSRKTDGAMAFIAAMTQAFMLEPYDKKQSAPSVLPGVMTF